MCMYVCFDSEGLHRAGIFNFLHSVTAAWRTRESVKWTRWLIHSRKEICDYRSYKTCTFC
jgi:hypothetical protein